MLGLLGLWTVNFKISDHACHARNVGEPTGWLAGLSNKNNNYFRDPFLDTKECPNSLPLSLSSQIIKSTKKMLDYLKTDQMLASRNQQRCPGPRCVQENIRIPREARTPAMNHFKCRRTDQLFCVR